MRTTCDAATVAAALREAAGWADTTVRLPYDWQIIRGAQHPRDGEVGVAVRLPRTGAVVLVVASGAVRSLPPRWADFHGDTLGQRLADVLARQFILNQRLSDDEAVDG